MKIRLGFVSNSSSSSFVAVALKSVYDEYIKTEDPIIQAIAETIIHEESVLGHECVTFSDSSGEGDWDWNPSAIITRAKEIAKEQNRPVSSDKDCPTEDNKELDDLLGELASDARYDIGHEIGSLGNKDESWSHSESW
ncbi:hypothetical protein LCGC14_1408980 [marine sediment metagenome]|uniref:Uncharacterized protein n=1 Tax=marine sediment metagenome TaxID=412755 RepID=A0A0F9JUV3_9ZZZZ